MVCFQNIQQHVTFVCKSGAEEPVVWQQWEFLLFISYIIAGIWTKPPHLIVWREEHKIRFYVPYSQSAIVLSGFLSSNSIPTSLKWSCLFKTQRGAVPKPAIRITGTKTVKTQSLILYLIRQLKKSIWIQQSASTNTEHGCLQRHVDLKGLSENICHNQMSSTPEKSGK